MPSKGEVKLTGQGTFTLRTSRGGTGLLEIIFAMSIFSMFLIGIFRLFSRSFQAYSFLESRQTLQGELLRIGHRMEADFRASHVASVGIRREVSEPNGEQRATVCCLGLDEWGVESNFTPDLRLPLWNQYIVYQSDTSEPGSLHRLLIEPSTLPVKVGPLDSLESFPQDRVLDRLNLSKNLHSFDAAVDPNRQDVTLSLTLLRKGGARGLDSKASTETVEAQFNWVPVNTVPRL